MSDEQQEEYRQSMYQKAKNSPLGLLDPNLRKVVEEDSYKKYGNALNLYSPKLRPPKYVSKNKTSRFNPKRPAYLYYVSINNGEAYKIGITNNNVFNRLNSSFADGKIDVLFTIYYNYGKEAFKNEQSILSKYKKYKYIGTPLLPNGNTELFSADILHNDFPKI